MTVLVPAIRASMGSTDYYQATIAARDLAAIAKTAAELDDWQQWSIFERFQRDIAMRRVDREIVPYLVHTKDRFFGALIVLVYKPDSFQFEPISNVANGLPAAYIGATESMGFLSISGGHLVVLDGQHRLAALRGVVTAGDEIQGPYRDAVVNDQLSVMFIRHESFEKTRRIFNKVNRYAKPTSTSDNIITSEDDGYAIVTRWLVEPTPPLGLNAPRPPFGNDLDYNHEPLIEWRSTSLIKDSRKITTLAALYSTTKTILHSNGITKFDEKSRINRPPDPELAVAYSIVADFWLSLLDAITPLSNGLKWPWKTPEARDYRAPHSLLFRPIGLEAFVESLVLATKYGMPHDDAIKAAARLNWRASDKMWVDTHIFVNGRMNTKSEGRALAARLGAYRIAKDYMDFETCAKLQSDLRAVKGSPRFRLPQN